MERAKGISMIQWRASGTMNEASWRMKNKRSRQNCERLNTTEAENLTHKRMSEIPYALGCMYREKS